MIVPCIGFLGIWKQKNQVRPQYHRLTHWQYSTFDRVFQSKLYSMLICTQVKCSKWYFEGNAGMNMINMKWNYFTRFISIKHELSAISFELKVSFSCYSMSDVQLVEHFCSENFFLCLFKRKRQMITWVERLSEKYFTRFFCGYCIFFYRFNTKPLILCLFCCLFAYNLFSFNVPLCWLAEHSHSQRLIPYSNRRCCCVCVRIFFFFALKLKEKGNMQIINTQKNVYHRPTNFLNW